MKSILKIICILSLTLLTACSKVDANDVKIEISANQTDNAEKTETVVNRVIDGDTFTILDGSKEIYVRLIGVDTPESVAPDEYLEKTGKENTEAGKDASDFTKSLIEGKTVYLEFDAKQEDKYGRLLAYVYLEDGRMLQDILITEGYANLMTIPPNVKYSDRFVEEMESMH